MSGVPHADDSTRGVSDTAARREAIQAIIRQQRIGTQDDLRRELKKRGFDVTQATLSRDLAKIEARRVTGSAGSFYEIAGAPISAGENELEQAKDMVISVGESHALVVVLTTTGAASVVASMLDRARLPEVMGTIAGDDTIFLAPTKRVSIATLAERLRTTWKKG